MTEFDYCISIIAALALGVLIGLERQWRHRLAGLRTTALVSLGSALFGSIGVLDTWSGDDKTRIAAQVVSGIGFLGGGIIMRDGHSIRGLNTAATVWCSAAVGLLCGMGRIRHATTAALLILAANVCLRPLVQKIESQQANNRNPQVDDEEVV